MLFGIVGVTVLIGPDALSGLGRGDWIGEVACLLAALTYGFAGIYGRKFKDVPPLKVATGQITASTIILLPIAAVVDRPWTLPPLICMSGRRSPASLFSAPRWLTCCTFAFWRQSGPRTCCW